jgi:hypothetical protein
LGNIDDSDINQHSFLTFDLFSSLNAFSPRYKVGYIRNICSKWKVGVNLGYGNRNISFINCIGHFEDNFQIWEVRPELYRIIKSNDKNAKYISTEIFYINHKDVFHNRYFYSKEGGEISYDQTNYMREKFGLNFNYGEFINLKKKIGLNIYGGLGLKMRYVSFNNVINPRSTYTFVDMFDFYQYREKEGLDFGFNISLGLRLLF